MDNPKHGCMMDRRIARLETRLGEIEMWMVNHDSDHRAIWKEVANAFQDGVKRMEETGDKVTIMGGQIRKLFSLVDAIAAKLGAG